MSTQTHTYDQGDTADLKYSGSWTLNGNWSDSAGDVGTLSVTNDPNAYVSFTFPSQFRIAYIFVDFAWTGLKADIKYLNFSAGHFIHIFWDAQVAWWAVRCMH
ncbi:hypothetical protein HYPSUDRAFT_87358 [Hypholoma sublateritium FD-334 SS-4]|uniref:Uncharacterized protein n=1 Tax=Hypholoma sublateritium (strain FD-334 SS-4) TaxID=945553 RepID=A0A0D2P1C5_HYPSF|nr:hypothetical protein HYPSUDRAFT_87358 [Hypholoma sublateritium FD-334 SS-4]